MSQTVSLPDEYLISTSRLFRQPVSEYPMIRPLANCTPGGLFSKLGTSPTMVYLVYEKSVFSSYFSIVFPCFPIKFLEVSPGAAQDTQRQAAGLRSSAGSESIAGRAGPCIGIYLHHFI